MKLTLKNNVSTSSTKEESLKKLAMRSTSLEQQLKSIGTENQISYDMVNDLSTRIKTIHNKNAHLADAVESEMNKKTTYGNKIKTLKQEIKRLKQSYVSDDVKTKRIRTERETLAREYEQLKLTKELILDDLELGVKAFDMDTTINAQLQNDIIKTQSNINHFNTSNISTKLSTLRSQFNDSYANQQNADIMYTIANELISAASQNEFDDLNWVAKVSSNNMQDGVKLRFRKMNTQYSEIKKVIGPLTRKFGEKYQAFGLDIEIRTKTEAGDTILALDFIIKMNRASKSKSTSISM